MNHTDFREDVIGGLVRHGGRLVSTEAFPWDPRDPDCDNDFHPGFRTQVDFPHWIVFLSSDGDPDWNDSDDYSVTFTLGAYFQHILDTSFESVRDSMVQELGNEWILEMAGDGVQVAGSSAPSTAGSEMTYAGSSTSSSVCARRSTIGSAHGRTFRGSND